MKEKIDIEALLVWAYRAQCVDRVFRQIKAATEPLRCYGSTWHGMAQIAELGAIIQSTGVGLAAVGASAADDAFIVHDAVMALDDVFVEWQTETRALLWTEQTAADNGRRIVKTGRGVGAMWRLCSAGHAPRELEFLGVTALMVTHARDDRRPEWHEGWTLPRGRRAGDRMATDRRGRKRKRYEMSAEQVSHDRCVYSVWHAALGLLSAQLYDRMAQYDVTGPLASSAPWLRDSPDKTGQKCQNVFPCNQLKYNNKINT